MVNKWIGCLKKLYKLYRQTAEQMLGQHGIVETGARAARGNFLEAGACRLALRILVHVFD
jgi:hypothetical protein